MSVSYPVLFSSRLIIWYINLYWVGKSKNRLPEIFLMIFYFKAIKLENFILSFNLPCAKKKIPNFPL